MLWSEQKRAASFVSCLLDILVVLFSIQPGKRLRGSKWSQFKGRQVSIILAPSSESHLTYSSFVVSSEFFICKDWQPGRGDDRLCFMVSHYCFLLHICLPFMALNAYQNSSFIIVVGSKESVGRSRAQSGRPPLFFQSSFLLLHLHMAALKAHHSRNS